MGSGEIWKVFLRFFLDLKHTVRKQKTEQRNEKKYVYKIKCGNMLELGKVEKNAREQVLL